MAPLLKRDGRRRLLASAVAYSSVVDPPPPFVSAWRFLAPRNASTDLLHYERTFEYHVPPDSAPEYIVDEEVGPTEMATTNPIGTTTSIRSTVEVLTKPTATSTASGAVVTTGIPGATTAVLFSIETLNVTWSSLGVALVILAVTVLLIGSSLLTIAVLLSESDSGGAGSTAAAKHVMGYYLISLAVSDLVCGTAITPLAVYAALDPAWQYGLSDRQTFICTFEAYIQVVTWSSVVYIFVWIGVDRYAALDKPSRYEIEQTATRCKCWIVFSWVTSLLLSCPILFTNMKTQYYADAYLCTLDFGSTLAYTVTLLILLLIPSILSIIRSYYFIFSSKLYPDDLEDAQRTQLDSDPNFMLSFFVILSFALSWLPWVALKVYENVEGSLGLPLLHFVLAWLAIGGGAWKLLVCLCCQSEFRDRLSVFCVSVCCLKCFCKKPLPTPPTQQPPQTRRRRPSTEYRQTMPLSPGGDGTDKGSDARLRDYQSINLGPPSSRSQRYL